VEVLIAAGFSFDHTRPLISKTGQGRLFFVSIFKTDLALCPACKYLPAQLAGPVGCARFFAAAGFFENSSGGIKKFGSQTRVFIDICRVR
jgi:hypothetical protein